MLRIFTVATALALGQDVPPPPQIPDKPPIPVVMVTTPPLAPPDLNTPYASPRDAARHRLQATLADLAANRNLKEALRGFAQAFIEDRTYAAAAFDLGIVAAIADKWADAVAALEEASRLEPAALGATAAPQLERLRMIATLEKTPAGQRKRRYDEALLPLLGKLPTLSASDANSAIAELGRFDPKRWEAPALLAGINGDGGGYQTASKFLEIAVANAAEPAVKQALERALRAAQLELLYSSTRAGAEAAADQGDYPKAAELYQSAWSSIPARVENGLDAVSTLLLSDDTSHASMLLARLRERGDSAVSPLAVAMLKELAPIETAASEETSDAAQFFHTPGPREPARIAAMIPAIDRKPLELYTRPLPKLVNDPEPVVLLASLAVDAPASDTLPALPQPSIAGENPWRELLAVRPTSENAATTPRSAQTVDLPGNAQEQRTLQVTTEPAGARVFIGGSPDSTCETPCNLRLLAGDYSLRLSLNGYRDAEQNIQVKSDLQDLAVPLAIFRGAILIETPGVSSIKINGTPLEAQSPAELSMTPGLYRIGANFGSGYRERLLTIKPGARLRLDLDVHRDSKQ